MAKSLGRLCLLLLAVRLEAGGLRPLFSFIRKAATSTALALPLSLAAPFHSLALSEWPQATIALSQSSFSTAAAQAALSTDEAAIRDFLYGAPSSDSPSSSTSTQASTAEPAAASVTAKKSSKTSTSQLQEAALFMEQVQATRAPLSDEFDVSFNVATPIGLSLEERSFQGFPTVVVKSIASEALKSAHPELRVGAIVTAINREAVDGKGLRKVGDIVAAAAAPTSLENGANTNAITIRFRDPSRYFELLDSTLGKPLTVITTSYLPANARDAGAAEQIIQLERLQMPPPEERARPAVYLDVMEIQYVCQLSNPAATQIAAGGSSSASASATASQTDSDKVTSPRMPMQIVDSSAERAPPGTSAQTIYYILGQQNGPPGKFPPGWDLALRGMVVGEKRRIVLPYTLAYERKGDKDRGIPPFATLVYTVKLKSLT